MFEAACFQANTNASFYDSGMPVQGAVDLTCNHFRYAGEFITSSITQAGPPPNFLSPCLYDVVSKGLADVKWTPDMIENFEMKDVTQWWI